MCADCGATADLTLDVLTADGTEIGSAERRHITMNPCAPDVIANVSSSSTDGRHRTFSFDVQWDGGSPIEYYVLRRFGPTGGGYSGPQSTFLYNVSCSAAETVPRASHVAVAYEQLTCTPGDAMSFTVGLDLPPDAAAYITPTYTYQWSLIGDRPPVPFFFSPPHIHTHPNRVPLRPPSSRAAHARACAPIPTRAPTRTQPSTS